MQDRYEALIEEMKQAYGLRVRRWRTSMTGCAWIVRYHNGRESRLIEAPYPRGPMSAAIFLHEVGHHAIGFRTYSPRCLEEYHAWRWSLEAMRQRGLNVTPAVERRMAESLHYAVAKAKRRGLKNVPEELVPFEHLARRPARRRTAAAPDRTLRPSPATSPAKVAARVLGGAMRQFWLFGAPADR